MEMATTDKNDYFRLLIPKKVMRHDQCKVYSVKSQDKSCIKPSNLNDDVDGAKLKPVRAHSWTPKRNILYITMFDH